MADRGKVEDESFDMDGQSSPKRARRVYDAVELDRLETVFANNSYPDRHHRSILANEMKVSPKNVQIWFQNRRARERTLQRKEKGIVENPIERMRVHLSRGSCPGGVTSVVPTTPQNENSFSSMSSSSSSSSSASLDADDRVTSVGIVHSRTERAPLAELNRGDTRWEPEQTSATRDLKRDIATDLASVEQFFRPAEIDGGSVGSSSWEPLPPTSGHELNNNFFLTLQPSTRRPNIVSLSEISNSSFTDINGDFGAGDEDSTKPLNTPTLALFSPTFEYVFDF